MIIRKCFSYDSISILKKLRNSVFSGGSICRTHRLTIEQTEAHRKSALAFDREPDDVPPNLQAPRYYKFMFPEFMPNPEPFRRDRICEKLERRDMLRRRAHIDIPEFYVGCIMAVTVSDQFAPGKQSRFVGICIARENYGLRASFVLRNVVDGLGVEIKYEMYNPTILSIQVLKLERRLDDNLMYLRDCPPEYSTFPFDMEAVSHPPGAAVPINPIKIQLNPLPWDRYWERYELKGVIIPELPSYREIRKHYNAKPWEHLDIMKQYRDEANEDEAQSISNEVFSNIQDTALRRRKERLSRSRGASSQQTQLKS